LRSLGPILSTLACTYSCVPLPEPTLMSGRSGDVSRYFSDERNSQNVTRAGILRTAFCARHSEAVASE